MSEKAFVCRCEDLTEEDVVNAIHEGYTDLEELRRKLRIGMGPCQGRVCITIVKKILKRETGKDVPETSFPKNRPPLIPVSLGALAKQGDRKDDEKE